MPLGTPSYLQEWDILAARSGAMVPSGLVLGGAYTFTAAQTIDLGTGASGITETGSLLTLRSADTSGVNLFTEAFGSNNGTLWAGYNVGGTRASKAATPNGVAFFTLVARGHDGSVVTGTKAYYSMSAGSLWAAGTNTETVHVWFATPNGSVTAVEWLRLKNSQILQLNSTAPTANTFAGNILFGVNNATADTAGQVGETITSTVSGVAVAATGTVGNVTSISLTAGKWEIKAWAVIAGGATGLTSGSTAQMSIVTTTATNGTAGATMTQQSVYALIAAGLIQLDIPTVVVNITATTTYYLTEQVAFVAGSPTAAATIVATRIR